MRKQRKQKTDWTQFEGLSFKEISFKFQRLIASIVVRLAIPGLTKEEYLQKRVEGFRICSYCIPHWQPEEKFPSTSPLCKEHKGYEARRTEARRVARFYKRTEGLALQNIMKSEGICLICLEKFPKKKGVNNQICKKDWQKNKLITKYTNQAKKISNCPPDYVEKRLQGYLFHKKCNDFFKPKTKKAFTCPKCNPPKNRLLKGMIAKWAIFAKNRDLDVNVHIDRMTNGYKICKKCYSYMEPINYKLGVCPGCKANPRCIYIKMKEGGKRRKMKPKVMASKD